MILQNNILLLITETTLFSAAYLFKFLSNINEKTSETEERRFIKLKIRIKRIKMRLLICILFLFTAKALTRTRKIYELYGIFLEET